MTASIWWKGLRLWEPASSAVRSPSAFSTARCETSCASTDSTKPAPSVRTPTAPKWNATTPAAITDSGATTLAQSGVPCSWRIAPTRRAASGVGIVASAMMRAVSSSGFASGRRLGVTRCAGHGRERARPRLARAIVAVEAPCGRPWPEPPEPCRPAQQLASDPRRHAALDGRDPARSGLDGGRLGLSVADPARTRPSAGRRRRRPRERDPARAGGRGRNGRGSRRLVARRNGRGGKRGAARPRRRRRRRRTTRRRSRLAAARGVNADGAALSAGLRAAAPRVSALTGTTFEIDEAGRATTAGTPPSPARAALRACANAWEAGQPAEVRNRAKLTATAIPDFNVRVHRIEVIAFLPSCRHDEHANAASSQSIATRRL